MRIINDLLSIPIAFILSPFQSGSPLVGLTLMSLIAGMGALFAVERTSPHAKVAVVKRSLVAALLEIVIFNHDVKAIAKAQWHILKLNVKYLRLSAVPLVATSVPIVLLMTHLHGYYGYRGLTPGEGALLTIDLAPGDRRPALTVNAPQGVRIASPMVWIPSLNQVIYRILPTQPGEYNLTLQLESESYEKTIVASSAWVSRSQVRVPPGIDALLYPAEESLPRTGPIRRISIGYPETNLRVGGWEIHWTWLFLGLSVLFSFALKALGVFSRGQTLLSSR